MNRHIAMPLERSRPPHQKWTFILRYSGFPEARDEVFQVLRVLVECWGEPDQHSTLNTLHKNVWDKYEEKIIAKRANKKGFRIKPLLWCLKLDVRETVDIKPRP